MGQLHDIKVQNLHLDIDTEIKCSTNLNKHSEDDNIVSSFSGIHLLAVRRGDGMLNNCRFVEANEMAFSLFDIS